MDLFIDTSNKNLYLILKNKDLIIDHITIDGNRKHTEQTIEEISKLLNKNNLKLKDINNFYTTYGPGSYTGVRVGLTIVKTIKIINPKVKVFVINSLLFQAGSDHLLSMLDARSNRFYVAECKNKKIISKIKILDCNDKNILESKLKKIINYKNINYLKKFNVLQKTFLEIKDFNNFNINYFKKI